MSITKVKTVMGWRGLMFGRVALMSLLLLLVLGTGGCGKSAQEAIIGTWKLTDKEQLMEFQADGVLLVHEGSGEIRNGTYEFPDPTHVVLTLSDIPRTFEVDIRFNQMMLTSNTGTSAQTGIFLRVQ